jgi:hypothetical protein
VSFAGALEELNERMIAVAALDRDTEERIAQVTGTPDELIRRVLNGYVPVEDTDHVMEFLSNAAHNLTVLVARADHPVALDAGLRFTVAQFLVVGVALGRQG